MEDLVKKKHGERKSRRRSAKEPQAHCSNTEENEKKNILFHKQLKRVESQITIEDSGESDSDCEQKLERLRSFLREEKLCHDKLVDRKDEEKRIITQNQVKDSKIGFKLLSEKESSDTTSVPDQLGHETSTPKQFSLSLKKNRPNLSNDKVSRREVASTENTDESPEDLKIVVAHLLKRKMAGSTDSEASTSKLKRLDNKQRREDEDRRPELSDRQVQSSRISEHERSPEVGSRAKNIRDSRVSLVKLELIGNVAKPTQNDKLKPLDRYIDVSEKDRDRRLQTEETKPQNPVENSPSKIRNTKITDYFFKIDKPTIFNDDDKSPTKPDKDLVLKERFGICKDPVVAGVDLKKAKTLASERKEPDSSINLNSKSTMAISPPSSSISHNNVLSSSFKSPTRLIHLLLEERPPVESESLTSHKIPQTLKILPSTSTEDEGVRRDEAMSSIRRRLQDQKASQKDSGMEANSSMPVTEQQLSPTKTNTSSDKTTPRLSKILRSHSVNVTLTPRKRLDLITVDPDTNESRSTATELNRKSPRIIRVEEKRDDSKVLGDRNDPREVPTAALEVDQNIDASADERGTLVRPPIIGGHSVARGKQTAQRRDQKKKNKKKISDASSPMLKLVSKNLSAALSSSENIEHRSSGLAGEEIVATPRSDSAPKTVTPAWSYGNNGISGTTTSATEVETSVPSTEISAPSETSLVEDADQNLEGSVFQVFSKFINTQRTLQAQDDWNGDEGVKADLSEFQRCKVRQLSRDNFQNLIVDLVLSESQIPARVTVMDFWRKTKLEIGDFVNIKATRQSDNWVVDNSGGFLVEQPDFLVSGTSVVGSLFCMRKSVLSYRFKEVESVTDCRQGAHPMVIGSLVHNWFQEVLRKKIDTKPAIAELLKNILNSQDTASMLYSASMSSEDCRKEMTPFIPKIFHFIERYVKANTSSSYIQTDDNFKEKINVIKDIEENFWVPRLGLKGKVDVTVEVGVNLRPRIMPLELKTGRASFSLEHTGQVSLYTMMIAATGQDVDAGLLLYLRENIMKEIKVGYREQRDLIVHRNNLARYLTSKPEESDFGMDLPEPINDRACRTCPYSALCCAYLSTEQTAQLSEGHPLTSMRESLNVYLNTEHIDYVKRWVKMLRIDAVDEEKAQSARSLWTVPPREREKKGKCLSGLKIDQVREEGGRYLHTFSRIGGNDTEIITDLTKTGFQPMEYVIVSTDTRVNVSAGLITEVTTGSATVTLERNLKKQRPKDVFHIDAHSSQGVLILNLSNIGYLLADTEVTKKIRKIVIEREPATFEKSQKRVKSVTDAVAAPILKSLNETQQRAALRVLAANDYLLIKGMPGTGKTRTLVATIQLLVKMGLSVLLTAHTHSAVDNVLLQLIKTDVDFVRLGSSTKIHPDLVSKSESVLTKDCYSPESLDAAYNSKSVVCVTCLGANHPLFRKRTFDVCLIDESTQVLQSSILRPLYSASKFVLVGDPDQLLPVVKSDEARSMRMDESLFDRLDSDNNTITLTSQYRMNRRIMSVANKVTYRGQLTVGTDEIGEATLHIPNESVLNSYEKWVRDALSTDLDDSVVALDTGDKRKILGEDGAMSNDCHTERRCSNLYEAVVILRLVTALIEAGVVADNVGVIAPYREQVSLLRDVVGQYVEVNTVDQYQGRDKEIIFHSGTISGSVESDHEFNILDDHRRLTVAITRAKHKLIMIGDIKNLKEYTPFKKFYEEIRPRDVTLLENGSAGFTWRELLLARM